MKGKENYLQENGKKFSNICRILRDHEVSFSKNQLYQRYYNRFQNLVTHLGWDFLLK